jgi:outer membrane protein OmpA-like peptidoglycan-associated protein
LSTPGPGNELANGVSFNRRPHVERMVSRDIKENLMSHHHLLRNAILVVALASTAATSLTGCADTSNFTTGSRGGDTAAGAGAGALAGAALGRMTSGGSPGRSTAQGALAGGALGAIGGYLWSNRMEQQKQRMQAATQGTGVEVTQTADNQLKLNIPSDISFDTGRADIKPNFRTVLDQFAQGLRDNQGSTVRVIGHTDSTGSDAINNPLSLARAESTRDYLADRGIAPARIAVDGRGEREPIADNNSEAGRARNRRVEIFVGEQQAAR